MYYICHVQQSYEKYLIMDASKKQIIKNKIKEVVKSNPDKGMVIICGLATRLKYKSRKDFGNMILSFLEKDNVNDISFKGIENGLLEFKVLNTPSASSFANDRGYGSGRYMGD